MPKIDGFELCKNIKNNFQTKSVPVIILTSFESEKNIEKEFTAVALAYVLKFDIKINLGETVKDILFKSNLNREQTIFNS